MRPERWGFVTRMGSPAFVRCCGERKGECAAVQWERFGEKGSRARFAVDEEPVDIRAAGGSGSGRYAKIAGAAMDRDRGKQRTAQNKRGAPGNLGVETHCREHIPGAHLAEIVVAGDAGGHVRPDRVQDLAHELLRLPGFAGKEVEPGCFDGGLVAELRVQGTCFGDGG